LGDALLKYLYVQTSVSMSFTLRSPSFIFFTSTSTSQTSTLSLHDALPIFLRDQDELQLLQREDKLLHVLFSSIPDDLALYDKPRSEEHTSELQSRGHHVCRLLLEKKKIRQDDQHVLPPLIHQLHQSVNNGI